VKPQNEFEEEEEGVVGADVLLLKKHGGAGVERRPVYTGRRCECLLSVTLRTLKARMTVVRIVVAKMATEGTKMINEAMRGRQSMMIPDYGLFP